MVKHKQHYKKTIIISLLFVALISGIGAFAYVNYINKDAKTETPIGGVNYDPPTKAEKQETEEFKKKQQEESSIDNTSPKNVSSNVVITYISSSEARGYVTGVVEDGGTCTATLTKGSQKVATSSTAIADVNKSTCGLLTLNSSQLSQGDWQVVLSYKSASIDASSPPQTLKVP